MGKYIDLTGQTFGRLVVIARDTDYISPSGYPKTRWRCRCSCGNITTVCTQELRKGDTRSCGCYELECKRNNNKTHGLSNTRLHSIWKGMKARCYNKHHKNYEDYGARGISVCDDWKNDFQKFYTWAMNNGYQDELTIERIDVNGAYCPENCCWVTRIAQANNRRNSISISYCGEDHTLQVWSKLTGIPYSTLYYRFKKNYGAKEILAQ